MLQIGIAVDNLGSNDLAFWTITNLNKVRWDIDVAAFYDTLQRHCMACRFATMQFAEAYDFEGVLLTTNLRQANQSLIFPSPKVKIFYPWDLEWMNHKPNFNSIDKILHLQTYARSGEHFTILEKMGFNVIGVLPDCDYKDLEAIAECHPR